MANSSTRILTTHTGSLPRPDELIRLINAREEGNLTDPSALEASVAAAVDEIVRKQVESGVDIVNDGEVSKISLRDDKSRSEQHEAYACGHD